MGITKLFLSAALTVSGLLPASCHKSSPTAAKTTSPTVGQTASAAGLAATNPVVALTQDLGDLALTNHCETRVHLGTGKDCIVTPKMLDKRTVQITLAVESRTNAGKIHDLAVTQIVTREGKSFEIAVGSYNLTMTPQIAFE